MDEKKLETQVEQVQQVQQQPAQPAPAPAPDAQQQDVEILKAIFPTGVAPADYQAAMAALKIGRAILGGLTLGSGQLPLLQAPLRAIDVGRAQTDAEKRDFLRQVVLANARQHAQRNESARVVRAAVAHSDHDDDLTKGSQRIISVIKKNGPMGVSKLVKAVGFNRTYVYGLLKELRDAHRIREEKDGRSYIVHLN